MLGYIFGQKPLVDALDANTKKTTNEKGAVAFDTTQQDVLDFFFQAVRGLNGARLNELLNAAYAEDQLLTLKAIFQLRDIRGKGKGERTLFRECMTWLAGVDSATLIANIKHVSEFGRWDDLFALYPLGGEVWDTVLTVICDQIQIDWNISRQAGTPNTKRVSILAKWMPSEGSTTWPKEVITSITRAVNNRIGRVTVTKSLPNSKTVSTIRLRGKQNYRYIMKTLRALLKLPEVLLAANRGSEIEFNSVSGQAMRRYGKTCSTKCGDVQCKSCKAFIRRDNARFTEFLAALAKPVVEGEPARVAKVNTRTLQPHEVVQGYLNTNHDDPMMDAMWTGIQERITGDLSKFFCLVDTSGSMGGIPMYVAIALGLLVSTRGNGPFKNAMITFETEPHFVNLQTTTIREQVQEVARLPWGGSTQIHRAFSLILQTAVANKLTQADLPEHFLILSDMQFDSADLSWRTNLEAARADFNAAGYVMPKLILWNLRSTSTFPTCNGVADGATMMSGFSPDMLTCMLNGEQYNPASAMLNILNDDRYSCLTLGV